MTDLPIRLKGMTWGHPRGIDPLRAVSRVMRERGIDVQWDERSLQGFEEASIAELASRYDMIAIDHPFMGMAYEQAALQPVDTILGDAFTNELQQFSVGPGYASYLWRERLWAVPIDAAAQVAALRQDLLANADLAAPASWAEVFSLAESLPVGQKIGLAANPTHLLLAFATICHAVSDNKSSLSDLRPGWWRDDGIDIPTAKAGLELLRQLMDVVHPLSWSADPIDLFEHMVREDDIVYTPVAFGYSNYARAQNGGSALSFRAVPSMEGSVGAGMLGGVGLAVSRRCTEIQAVGEYLRFVACADIQAGLYLDAGGQPAHRAAWTRPETEKICPHFFGATLASLDKSFMRPRIPAYPSFQRDGGKLLYSLLHEQKTADMDIITALNKLWVGIP